MQRKHGQREHDQRDGRGREDAPEDRGLDAQEGLEGAGSDCAQRGLHGVAVEVHRDTLVRHLELEGDGLVCLRHDVLCLVLALTAPVKLALDGLRGAPYL